jgi:glutathione peroxidase
MRNLWASLQQSLLCVIACILLMSTAQATAADMCKPVLDYQFPGLIDGKSKSLCDYAGKVILVVNTASECGYTPQYEGLEALYKRYQSRGVLVVGF